jgi:hypothetical protein
MIMVHLKKAKGRGELGAVPTAFDKQKSHGQRLEGLSMARLVRIFRFPYVLLSSGQTCA